MELKDMDVNYEKQGFDELNINPYELVIAVSKKARELNSKAIKYLGPEVQFKPINMALNKLKNGDIAFTYDEQKKNESESQPRKFNINDTIAFTGDDE